MPRTEGTFRIREAVPEDAPRLVPLFEAFYGEWFEETFTVEAVEKRIRSVSGFETVLVAESAGRLTGFASLRLVPSLDPAPHSELTDLFVAEGFRRRGIASALVARREELARSRGATQVIVLTGSSNRDAMAFYRSLGYGDYAVAFRKRFKP